MDKCLRKKIGMFCQFLSFFLFFRFYRVLEGAWSMEALRYSTYPNQREKNKETMLMKTQPQTNSCMVFDDPSITPPPKKKNILRLDPIDTRVHAPSEYNRVLKSRIILLASAGLLRNAGESQDVGPQH